MWLSLFCLALIVGIAFFNSIHGLFNALIFCMLTLLCLAFSFAMYEYVAFELLMQWKPDVALPISLVGCFAIPLIIGRVALDQAIGRANLLPALFERAGGFLFGLVTAVLIVGVLATAAQMLPFGGSVVGFSRFELPPRPKPGAESETEKWEVDDYREHGQRMIEADDNNLILSPDAVAVKLATIFSDGVFSGSYSFRRDHPDLLAEIGWSQAAEPGTRMVAERGTLATDPFYVTDYVYNKIAPNRTNPTTTYEPEEPQAGYEFWVISLSPGEEGRDSEREHRFTLPQIRMVGNDRDGLPVQYIPSAIRDNDDPSKHVREQREGRDATWSVFGLWTPYEDGSIEVVFEVRKGFEPRLLTYKSGVRAEDLRAPSGDEILHAAADEEDEDEEASDDDADEAAASSTATGRRSGGRVSGARPTVGGTFFSDKLPGGLTLTNYSGRETEVRNEELQSGHVVAVLGLQDQQDDDPITGFQVPEGKRLLHLQAEVLEAKSTLGRALSFSVRTIRNYLVTDDRGKQYEMIGQYALADVRGDDMFELQYFPEQIGSMGSGIRDFQDIKRSHLRQDDTVLVYLYLIDEGAQVMQFSTGSGRRSIDLSDDDLVAE